MTREQVNRMINEGILPDAYREFVETHVSWVILCDRFAYKIKKPVQYSFLDFSTIEKRKYFCEREIQLNKRLTEGIYLDVQPICETAGRFVMGSDLGALIEYAVRMFRQDQDKQMDRLLMRNKVTVTDIRNIAEKIASFHAITKIIYEKRITEVGEKFNDLAVETDFLAESSVDGGDIIKRAMETSARFMEQNSKLIAERLSNGYFRDCHGDLHSRNIFLLSSPQPFDCIEFNDDYRQIDVLNEIAFLCMDLDAFNRKDLSESFVEYYKEFFY